MKIYTVERQVRKVSTGWFRYKLVPLWCLVEYGTHYMHSYGGGGCADIDERPYQKVLLASDDKTYILQEYANFTGTNYVN